MIAAFWRGSEPTKREAASRRGQAELRHGGSIVLDYNEDAVQRSAQPAGGTLLVQLGSSLGEQDTSRRDRNYGLEV
ncbi:MAG: hypothetical protein STHCBS139747_001694 [Sporothrix thermara]